MAKEIFNSLKKRLEKPPGPEFDKTFWTQFENEFQANTASGFRWWKLATPFALALVVVSSYWFLSRSPTVPPQSPLFAEVIENQLLLENLDLLATLEDIDLSDQEWQILLEGDDES